MQLYKLNQLLLDMHSGGTPDTSKPEYWNGNFKWLSSGETRQRFIENTESQITQLGIEKSSTKLAKKNDVVMACAGQGKTRGQVSFLLDDMYINQSVIAMTTDEKILHPLYLFYNLSGRYNELRGSSDASSTRGSITTKSLKKLAMLIPNIESQKNITDILIAYDNLIENNNKRIKLLEQMVENLYKEWFVRFRFPEYEDEEFKSGIPKGWEILRADQLFDITIGKTPDRKIFEYFSNIPECNYPWISISDMRSASTFVFKTKEYLTFNAVNTCNVKIIPKNTVIVSFKLTVGQVAITTSDMCTNEAIAHFATDNAAMREYIYLYLKKFQYSDLGNTSSIGTAVNSKIIKNMKIILPSSELLNRFHNSTYSIFEEIRLLNETNNNLIKQRDMLLPRLMSGKLEV